MTLRRVAGEVPDFGGRKVNEFMRAFDRFGQLQSWTPEIEYPGVTFTSVDLYGRYIRIGPAVIFLITGSFTTSGATPPQVYISLPLPVNPIFLTGFYCASCFHTNNSPTVPEFDFVPGFVFATRTLAIPPTASLTVNWSNGSKEVSGFGFYWV
jgi:hypothetical protein